MQEAEVIGDFLFPADQQPPGSVEPRVRAFHFPAASFAAAMLRLRNVVRRLARERAACSCACGLRVPPVRRCILCRGKDAAARTVRARGRETGMRVERGGDQLWSCTLAPSTATASGTPRPSISTDRLTPSLPRSVGFFPVFFPTQRRLGHRPVHALPFPVDPFQVVVLVQGESPQFLEHAQLNPLLKVGVNRAARAELAWASPSTDNLSTAHTKCRPRRFAWAAADGRLYNCDL